jgi:hypothetical protein
MSKRQVQAAEVVKVLTEAKKHIDAPEKWCKNMMHSNNEQKSCAIGAIHKVIGHDTPLWNLALDALGKAIPGDPWPPNYNDLPSTTHADVMSAYDRAIEMQCEIVREEAEKDDSHLSD